MKPRTRAHDPGELIKRMNDGGIGGRHAFSNPDGSIPESPPAAPEPSKPEAEPEKNPEKEAQQ